MVNFFILFTILGMGVLLHLSPPSWLFQGEYVGAVKIWVLNLKFIAIPIAFIILGWSKHIIAKLLQLAWGILLSILSLIVLVESKNLVIGDYGFQFTCFILVLSLSLTLFTSFVLIKRNKV